MGSVVNKSKFRPTIIKLYCKSEFTFYNIAIQLEIGEV